MDAKRIIIVANRTAGGAHLKRLVRARMADGRCRFILVVPATPPPGGLAWTHAEARALAEWRLRSALDGLRDLGADVEGAVGDTMPIDAVTAALSAGGADEIVVSTLPYGLSRWIRQDLPRRILRAFGVPVTHVTSDAALDDDPLRRFEVHLGVA
jgi:hypothetical protein